MLPADLPVTHKRAKANGIDIHWVESGEGPAVVLLHGFPENWWSWRYQIGTLAGAGLRVIAPDLRGYNETEKKGPYDLDTLAEDAAALIKVSGAERASVVGHGWGGAVTWRLAATKPEVVDRVVVLECPHPARMFDALKTSPAMLKKSWYFLFFQLPWLPELLMSQDRAERMIKVYRSYTHSRHHFSAAELQPFVDALDQPGAAKAMLGAYRAVFTQALKDGFRLGAYPLINAEVLMLFARNAGELKYDDLVPGMDKYAPKLTVQGFDACGRFLHAETPQAVNDALLKFLVRGASDVVRPATGEVPTEFTVVLEESSGENKITIIKEIRAITGLDLKQARELVEAAPSTVKAKVSLVEALKIKSILTAAGAKVGLR